MENEGSPSVVASDTSEGIGGWIESMVITASQTSVGQALFKLFDSFLWVVEKSAQWSLPSHEIAAEENGKVFGKIELVRPLPWILFLPGLVILRIIRIGLNVGAFILGYPAVQPSGMVKFVQKSRRRLRAFNLKAVKSARQNSKDKRLTMIEAKKALIRSIKLTLSTLSCLDTSKSSPSPPPTKICISNMEFETVATPDEKSTTESVGSPIHTKIKRKFSQVITDEESSDESENETLQTKLDRLALEDSTDDPDFNPAECSTESSTASSESEMEKEVCLTELVEVQEDANQFLKDNEEKPLLISLENLNSNSMNTEETMADLKHDVDSSESKLEMVSRLTNDFINGEINSTVDIPPKEAAPAPDVVDTEVIKSQPIQTSKTALSRSFVANENSSTIPERKGNKHKKLGRRETK